MKSFKVGDRVRIVCPHSVANDDTGTVVGTCTGRGISTVTGEVLPKAFRYGVRADNNHSPKPTGEFYYLPEELRPIVNPDETAWTEFKRHLQPGPAIILAKEAA